jgi:hypothetical protein
MGVSLVRAGSCWFVRFGNQIFVMLDDGPTEKGPLFQRCTIPFLVVLLSPAFVIIVVKTYTYIIFLLYCMWYVSHKIAFERLTCRV